MNKKLQLASVALAPLILLGCGGGSSTSSSGSVTLRVTDAPVDSADAVWVQFSGVEIHGSAAKYTYYFCKDPVSGSTFTSTSICQESAPKRINLLALTNGASDLLLDDQTLATGQYQWIRLMVDAVPNQRDSYIVVSGAEHELEIPSGAESGLKLNRGFDVTASGDVDFTIDFDLRKSVHVSNSGSTYKLRPTLRIVDNTQTGTLSGTVATALVTSNCSGAVYLFSGHNITPDDIGSSTEPVVTALISQDNLTATFNYKLSFVEAGNYTVAFTCNVATDAPDTNDNVTFSATTNVTVTSSANGVQALN